MTIEKEPPGLWFLTCDGCQDRVELDTDPDDGFIEAVKEARKHGYTLRNVRGEWIHICIPCQNEARRKILKDAGL